MEPYTVEISPSLLHFNPHLIADAADGLARVQRIMGHVEPQTLSDRVRQLEVRVSWLERRSDGR